jgi:hypothetical protein
MPFFNAVISAPPPPRPAGPTIHDAAYYKGYCAPGFVENFSRQQWFAKMGVVKNIRRDAGDAAIGLRRLGPALIPCEGGFCKRHHFRRIADYETIPSGYLFCNDCAILWATKVAIGCRSNWPN